MQIVYFITKHLNILRDRNNFSEYFPALIRFENASGAVGVEVVQQVADAHATAKHECIEQYRCQRPPIESQDVKHTDELCVSRQRSGRICWEGATSKLIDTFV